MSSDGFGSFARWRRRFRTDEDCRAFLEPLIWPHGPHCPHCGSVDVGRFTKPGRKSRAGLFQCRERECRGQFTLTTKTPLHGTKLPLALWVQAIYLILGSSKGLSSVVLARILGVSQKTAWKMGHAIRELLAGFYANADKLAGTVEVDTFYTGGSPKKHTKWHKYVHVPRGKGAGKTPVMVVKSRQGAARATILPGEAGADIKPILSEFVDKRATLMSDSDKGLKVAGKDFAGHQTVNHSAKEYVRGNVHANTVEALGGILHRAVFGVYHHLSPEHLQRYLDEMGFRWSHRWIETKTGRNGRLVSQMKTAPFEIQLGKLLRHAVGRELRYSAVGGIRKPAGGKSRPGGGARHKLADKIPF